MSRGRLAFLFLLGACTEQVTAPGACPDFCPGAAIGVVDTILNVIERDSAYAGYLMANEAPGLPVAALGVVDSRAIFRTVPLFTHIPNRTGDTTTVPITMDSVRLRLTIVHRDTNTANLWIKLFRVPTDIDSTTTFAQLAPSFAGPAVDSVNVSALLRTPQIYDSVTLRIWGDTIQTDSAGHVLQVASDSSLVLSVHLDTAQARFAVPDSATVAYGVRVAADSLGSIVLGSNESTRGPRVTWFYTYPDTNAAPLQGSRDRAALFDSFVFDPPTPALDSNLAVGGVPSARSLLRVTIPALLRDSADVVRATLILVPVGPVPGARGDSFAVLARPVLTDIGAKSPLNTNSAFFGLATVHLNAADTVRVEMTNLIRTWARADTSTTTTFVLQQRPEGAAYTQIRFYSTRAPAFRPALHVTYVRRYAFGGP
jgi:hypothetical protein